MMQHAGTNPTTENHWNMIPTGNCYSGLSFKHGLEMSDVSASMTYPLHHQGLEVVLLMHVDCFTGSTFCHTSAGLAQSQQDWVRVIVRRHASCALNSSQVTTNPIFPIILTAVVNRSSRNGVLKGKANGS